MSYVDCSCGLNYDARISSSGCPKCGKSVEGTAPRPLPGPAGVEEKIRFSCPVCGLRLTASAASVGRSIDCLACGKPAAVPAANTGTEIARAAPTARRPSPTTAAPRPSAPTDGWRSTARWSLFAALLPLAVFTFAPPDDTKERLRRTIKQHPEIVSKLQGKEPTLDNVLKALPFQRAEGAALSRATFAHWVMALLAALIFWEFILIVQPMGTSTSRQLWAVGAFTGTIGILMLLIVTVGGIAAAILNIPVLKYIGYSYGAAVDPKNGFLASMVGFTIGVGFLEELCKALPLYWHFRRSATLDARGAVVWGLATGIGFGVSEGIFYSNSWYNGLQGGGIYLVRFISCVALHAVWSATVAILIWKRQESIQNIARWYQWFPAVFGSLWISMIIHGFYDTVLKKEYGVAALASAILSFALFFWLYDRACREERTLRASAALA